jgi:hypothetical protein
MDSIQHFLGQQRISLFSHDFVQPDSMFNTNENAFYASLEICYFTLPVQSLNYTTLFQPLVQNPKSVLGIPAKMMLYLIYCNTTGKITTLQLQHFYLVPTQFVLNIGTALTDSSY